MFQQLGLIGCGLMGASFALALRQASGVRRIVGHSASAATVQRALARGVIDAGASSAAEAAAGSDLVLLAVPVAATEASLAALAPALGPDALLMDVGSTKRDVVAAARRTLGGKLAHFVPCHPIAGKEKAGLDHAEAALYRGRQTILTPLPENPPGRVDRAEAVWTALGSRVLRLSPEAHDAHYAAVSHLPHLLAFAAFQAVAAQAEGAAHLALAGPGFRDFSRIAASDPAVWRDILQANRDEVLRQLDAFEAELARWRAVLQAGDAAALEALIRPPAAGRSAWTMGAPGCGLTPPEPPPRQP